VSPRPPLRIATPPRTHEPPAHGDLSLGFPDPALLPSIPPALTRIDLEAKLEIPSLDAHDPELLELAAASFGADGVPTGALSVVAGALDGIERVLNAHLRPGDRVLIEDPAYPPVRDLLTALGLIAVPAPVDDRGLIPDHVQECLERGIEAVIAVPRAQNPFGSAFDAARAAELRAALTTTPQVLIVEDDHAGIVAGAPYTSLVPDGWPRWATLRSVSKVLHPDMRLAFMAGDETTVARVEGRQWLGPRWVSHILQAIVVELLEDPGFETAAARARDAYAARRTALIAALAEHGIAAHGRSGLNVWVPVPEEAPVVRAALDAGWLVLAGERCRLATPPAVRVTTAMLAEEGAPSLADALAGATRSGRPRRAY
jgi:DNA-binding transcriptional MocR family regulator